MIRVGQRAATPPATVASLRRSYIARADSSHEASRPCPQPISSDAADPGSGRAQQAGKYRVAAELAAREVPGETAGRAGKASAAASTSAAMNGRFMSM